MQQRGRQHRRAEVHVPRQHLQQRPQEHHSLRAVILTVHYGQLEQPRHVHFGIGWALYADRQAERVRYCVVATTRIAGTNRELNY